MEWAATQRLGRIGMSFYPQSRDSHSFGDEAGGANVDLFWREDGQRYLLLSWNECHFVAASLGSVLPATQALA